MFLDPHTLDVGGKRVTAEHIVIATGGHPERVPIPGAELGIISDDAFFLPKMPERVAIIGSGYIAVEFAGIFQALGAEVHLIYRQPLPLRGFDQDLREGLAEALGTQGVALHPGCRPLKLEADGDRRVLTFGDNHTLRADLVFFATGRRPATENLGLDKAGVRLDDKGAVIVDAHLRATQHAHLRDGRRDRPGQPDAGRHRRGPRAGRHAVRQASAQHLAGQRAVGGVLHPADRHRRADGGASGGAWAGRCVCVEVHADAAHAVRPRRGGR